VESLLLVNLVVEIEESGGSAMVQDGEDFEIPAL
jgi:hypothetical protein